MIENSDRGITLAKPLAWSMLCGLIGAVWYVGSTVTSLSNSSQAVTDALVIMQADNVQVEGRVRQLENNAAAGLARYDALKASMDELKEQQRESNTLLRQILQGNRP